MQDVTMQTFEFRGNHYDHGVAQAQWLQTTKMLENREHEWKIRRPRFDININETKDIYQKFAPQIWEELMGIQDTLKMPLDLILLNYGHYRVYAKDSGCSIFLGRDYMVRNYDYNPATYDGRLSLFQPTDGGYAQIGPTSRLTGRMDGMNEHGLAMGYNFMHRKKPGDGFVCYMIGRLILETCKNIDEAVTLLKEIPHRSSFSYILMDANNESIIVEATPRAVITKHSQLCTNHFEVLTHENRNYIKESEERFDRIEQITNSNLELDQAFHYFNDPQYEIYSKLFNSWSGTIHTSAYIPSKLEVLFALGENGHIHHFDFQNWLNGTPLNHHSIFGKIDSDIQFSSE
ncbi:C45 family autoproteolytic acyltransferase/hydolase [Mammaliicoccus stepanovicii]|uniref:Choloylglycine hydrolase n=1 Tax=Mammaliicoccus stepanovicii TaxID=643214 RepID=A0A239YRS9_9STAP|nr:C45 family autoproteolytic acyltransferase/hydolase [Mammaliicoccus stepanovicii]PNZ73221.1 acyl-CoA--6-aminopenicillanic acid acyltransferase [Mammaliicoccus stepanovicii]GGI42397.1 choloylglycine hydrolase [Mammaliicoccus stepanovicii]SNV61480.1 choloylglycine hydrolase [Mammaliicoccus stepanovicii]